MSEIEKIEIIETEKGKKSVIMIKRKEIEIESEKERKLEIKTKRNTADPNDHAMNSRNCTIKNIKNTIKIKIKIITKTIKIKTIKIKTKKNG